jgi:hypothetical protein
MMRLVHRHAVACLNSGVRVSVAMLNTFHDMSARL